MMHNIVVPNACFHAELQWRMCHSMLRFGDVDKRDISNDDWQTRFLPDKETNTTEKWLGQKIWSQFNTFQELAKPILSPFLSETQFEQV